MKEHPIKLLQVMFTRSIVVAVPGHTRSGSTLAHSPSNTLSMKALPGSPRRYMVVLRSVFNEGSEPSSPYMIDMECVGQFVVDDALPEADTERGVKITAHTVLYGAVREAVSWITGRQPYGPLTLGLSILQFSQNAEPGIDAAPDQAPAPRKPRRRKPAAATE